MKIKKLEINGFKSFSEKASIRFPSGVCAVVGPNGCGKSNIVDALRWVMGEQSLKQLRGKSKEDIIFAGASGRPPLNMAEVSLTLANDNGGAPEALRDFTEINITRRLYRSGESAYFINRQPCRLKDVHNVFLGSGLGAKSYAVIGQGNIGAITDADPEQRRYFVEEAAGVTRYKSRKNEALRKVKATQQNLLRVADIIVELERQMRGLKRQARRAERFKILQERIQTLDIRLSLFTHEELSHKIAETSQLLQELKESDFGQITEIKKLDAAVEGIKLARTRKNQEIATLRTQQHDAQRQIDRSESELRHGREETQRLITELQQLKEAHANLLEKNEEMQSEIGQVEAQYVQTQQQLQQFQATLESENRQAAHLKDELTNLTRRQESQKTELMELIAQEARLKNIYQTATNNKDNLQRRLKRIDEEVLLAERKQEDLLQQVDQATAHLDACRQKIKALESDIESAQNQLADRQTHLTGCIKTLQALEMNRREIRSEHTALKKMSDSYAWYRGGVRALLADTQAPADGAPGGAVVEGLQGILADILEPVGDYAAAVEAVLGDRLQYILTDNTPQALAAIDYLIDHNAGKCGFIPLPEIRPPGFNRLAHIPDELRLLSHVRVPAKYQALAELVLGHVLVANDLDEALGLRQTTPQAKVVTRQGHIVNQAGFIMGGSQGEDDGILVKKQTLKALAQTLADLDGQCQQALEVQQACELEVRKYEQRLQERLQQKNRLVQTEIEAEKERYRLAEDLKHAQRHLEVVQLEQEQLMGEEMDLDSELAEYNQALAGTTEKIKAAQMATAESGTAMESLTRRMEQFNQKVVDIKMQRTALSAQSENNRTTLNRLKQFHADGLHRADEVVNDIAAKHQRLETTREKMTHLDQQLKISYQETQEAAQRLQTSEAAYQQIESQLGDHDEQIAKIKDAREQSLEKFRLLEVEVSQLEFKRDNLVERLAEVYQKTISDLRSGYYVPPEELDTSRENMQTQLARSKKRLMAIGDVNLGAIAEYQQIRDRFEFMVAQREDLEKAIENLHSVIRKINRITQKRFLETLTLINQKLTEVFPKLFNGGSSELIMTDPDKPLESGVEFMIHPPGKKLTRLSLLSGGEKALSAIAFIFAIFLIKPASFCLMDEIDAPLDDANVFRFNDLLKMIGTQSQIIMITHNKRTMEFADTLLGITMERKGISKVVAVNLQ